MKPLLDPIRRRSAFTYMTVVVTMIVVGLMLAAYLKLVAVQNQMTVRSQTWNRNVPVLEAGIEEAMAHLNKNGAPDEAMVFNVSKLSADGWSGGTSSGWTKTTPGKLDNDYYFVSIGSWNVAGGLAPNNYPMIMSTGFVQHLPAFAAIKWNSGPFVADLVDILSRYGYSKRVVQCTTTNVPTFTKALVAKRGIVLAGQRVRTDSFDSGVPAYNDGFGHYTNTPGKWKTNGDIASNDTVTNAVDGGNANIFGKVATGPYGTIKIGAGGMVGDVAWQSNDGNKGKIQPGWSTDDMNMEFPSVRIPPVSWLPPTGQKWNDPVTGEEYATYLKGSNDPDRPTDIRWEGGDVKGKVYVEGHVRLLVQTPSKIDLRGGTDVIRVASGTNNSIRIYADCDASYIGGNGVQNDGIAAQFYYFGTDKNTSINYAGNAAFTGVFYAPNAAMTLGGGGSQQIDFSGSAIARDIKLNGNFTFHYDEALKRVGLYKGFVITSWNEK
jgi:hypothetical protein